MSEQAELETAEINQDSNVDVSTHEDQGIKSILNDALKGDKSGTPEVQPAPALEPSAEQSQELETPYLELVNGETKLPFKSEEDFIKFLESNQVLKDGWLRQSDYTRKTQELSQMREQLEQSTKEDQKAWGGEKPDTQSMRSLQTLWNVYTQGDPLIQDSINKFVSDVHLISRGQQPVGPLKDIMGGSQPNNQANQDPVISQLNQKVATLEKELRGFRQQTEQERQASFAKQQEAQRIEADKTVDSWISAKEKAGVKLSQDELSIMADLMSVLDEKGQPKLSLDEAHNMALAKLGKLQSSVAKQVLNDANKAKKRSPLAPSSRGSAGDEPEATTIKGILSQGVKHLSGE